MADALKIEFSTPAVPESGDLVVLVSDGLALGALASELLGESAALIARAAKAERFKGKAKSTLTIAAPAGLSVDRLVVVGIGGEKERSEIDLVALGAVVQAKVAGREATLVADAPGLALDAEAIAEMSLGARLRAYKFDRYKSKASKKNDNDEEKSGGRLVFASSDPAAAKKAAKARETLAAGVNLCRDLVNEPANVLGPVEFAQAAEELGKLGVEVTILEEKQLAKIGMRALLGVAQGSERPARVAVMAWHGGAKKEKPLALVGKGVVFDTGGISIKPAASMEDMKGDMAGAACVVGAMHALAARKAKANVIGIIGLVENMPDGRAQRPGDIVETLSGQTVEIINTDAEGRLVLADLLTYVRREYEPAAIVDFATLTGAIIVALGQEYAGLFCNDDALAGKLLAASETSGDKLWRMPLGASYDKQIDSKFADMKNSAGRYGSSITAAQFLKRFVDETPWAHVDLAGTAMAAPQTDINKSWGSGYGVRLVDRLVRDAYEG